MLASLGGLVSCAAKVHFKEAGNAMNELIANHDFDFRQLVTAAEGQPVTDTFQIARAFGKRHQHVIRAIKCLRCSEEFSTTHFWAVEKINDLGIFDKKQIYYRMDFSGFVMLVMGFNGAKADAVKEAYINAFNWMSAELRKYSESYEAERNAIMLEYMKVNRPGFPGEYFICELRLPDHYFRWKHNKLFLLLPEEYGPAFPAIVDCYTSPPT